MQIKGIRNYSSTPSLSFQRKLKPEEEQGYHHTLTKSYDAMGVNKRIVINHGSCYPALNRDTNIGSPYGKAANVCNSFYYLHGFNGVQLGPSGELEKDNISPYNSSAFAKNKLFIDLEQLTEDKYSNILSKQTFKKVTEKPVTSDKNYTFTDFDKSEKTYNTALQEAFINFDDKVRNKDPNTKELNAKFYEFKNKHKVRLTNEGIFKVLSNKYDTDDFSKWDEMDRDLAVNVNKGDIKSLKHYNKLLNENKNAVEQYKFEQFIATDQIKENKKWRDKLGFEHISDLLVGCSKMDQWRYKEAFLDDYEMGAFEGDHKPPQIWKIPVLNPRTLFKGENLDLNTGGQFLKEKLEFALEFSENTRIDHAMGLIEPYLIDKNSVQHHEDDTIDLNKLRTSYMSETYGDDGKKLDDYYNYPRILEKIILPTLEEYGLDKTDPVWEDACSRPTLFNQIYYSKNKLPRLMQLEWAKTENEENQHWYLIGSHDSIPTRNMIKRNFTKESKAWDPLYLAGILKADPAKHRKCTSYCNTIAKNDDELVKAKFAELVSTKKFQISFADIFGITEDNIVYNIGGTENETNWKTRITPDFIEKYYEDLSSDNPTALNIPEILKLALEGKIQMEIAKTFVQNNNRETEIVRTCKRKELYGKYQPLLNELDKYAKILKEKE